MAICIEFSSMDQTEVIETIEGAEIRRQQLTMEIQTIQAQLGDRQRVDESGQRLSASEYWSWKRKATHALNRKLDELRLVKAWVRDNQGDRTMVSVIAGLARIIDRAVLLGFTPSEDESFVLKQASALASAPPR